LAEPSVARRMCLNMMGLFSQEVLDAHHFAPMRAGILDLHQIQARPGAVLAAGSGLVAGVRAIELADQ
ncbi:MAG: hypothetical protein WB775_17715, partial [Burkholderiaceae bacterium]